MISDAERRRLAEIEAVLRREDPALVQRFEKQRRTARCRGIRARLAIPLVLAVIAVAVALGGAVAAVNALLVMGVIGVAIGLWRRYRAWPPRRR